MNSVTEDDRLIDWQTDLRCSFVSSRIARCHAVGTAAVGSPCRPRPGSAARQSTSRPSCTQLRTHRHQRCSVLAAKVVSKPKWWASAWQSMTDLAGIIITRSFCFFRERPMFSVCPWRLWEPCGWRQMLIDVWVSLCLTKARHLDWEDNRVWQLLPVR